MKRTYPPCDLCGQPVKLKGFILNSPDGTKNFCCEGCLRIFQLLGFEQDSSEPLPEKNP